MQDNPLQIRFENNSDNVGYLLRLGHKNHLEQIQAGKIRFSKLKNIQRLKIKTLEILMKD